MLHLESSSRSRGRAAPWWRWPAAQIACGLGTVAAAAAVVAIVQTGSPAPVLLAPIAAVLGPIVGLTSDAPYFTPAFKLGLLAALAVAVGLMLGGWWRRERAVGRVAVVLGLLLWVMAGFLGFGPQ